MFTKIAIPLLLMAAVTGCATQTPSCVTLAIDSNTQPGLRTGPFGWQ